MGRLCDAVAALAGVCQTASYEAQAAIELEALVDSRALAPFDEPSDSGYAFHYLVGGGVTIIDPAPLIRQVVADVQSGRPAGWIATHFHAALVRLIVQLSHDVRAQTGIAQVALSGGVFQNMVLLGGAVSALRRAGFTVLVHRRVPPNDAGLALGQAIVAARQLFR
jgi:hydrogenase maturation protein HypF